MHREYSSTESCCSKYIVTLLYIIPSTQHKVLNYRYMFRLNKSSSGLSKNHKLITIKQIYRINKQRDDFSQIVGQKFPGYLEGHLKNYAMFQTCTYPINVFSRKHLTTVHGHLAGKHWLTDSSTVESTFNSRQRQANPLLPKAFGLTPSTQKPSCPKSVGGAVARG